MARRIQVARLLPVRSPVAVLIGEALLCGAAAVTSRRLDSFVRPETSARRSARTACQSRDNSNPKLISRRIGPAGRPRRAIPISPPDLRHCRPGSNGQRAPPVLWRRRLEFERPSVRYGPTSGRHVRQRRVNEKLTCERAARADFSRRDNLRPRFSQIAGHALASRPPGTLARFVTLSRSPTGYSVTNTLTRRPGGRRR